MIDLVRNPSQIKNQIVTNIPNKVTMSLAKWHTVSIIKQITLIVMHARRRNAWFGDSINDW